MKKKIKFSKRLITLTNEGLHSKTRKITDSEIMEVLEAINKNYSFELKKMHLEEWPNSKCYIVINCRSTDWTNIISYFMKALDGWIKNVKW